jgi:sigma-B regulation protein RsbU (phosphoserine phosphatase)
MVSIDLTQSRRIPFQLQLLSTCTRMKNPTTVFDIFVGAMQHLYGPRRYLLLNLPPAAGGAYSIGMFVDETATDRVCAVDPLRHDGLPEYQGGFLQQIVDAPGPLLLHDLDVCDDPVLGDSLAGYGAMMGVPMFDEGRITHVLLVLDRNPRAFSVTELEELNLRANLVGVMVQKMDVARQLEDAYAHIQREVDRIGIIQRSLLPEPIPLIGQTKVAVSYETFDKAGGDLYDIHQIKPDLWALLIADASGHGPAAAVMAAMLHGLIRGYFRQPCGPAELLSHANQYLCQKRIGDSFVTAFLGFYDSARLEMTYASAGHHPPLIKRPGSEIALHLNDANDLPLGIDPATRYEQGNVRLQPLNTLLLYTDGVPEAMNPRGEMFGTAALEEVVAACNGDPQCMVDSLLCAVHAHESGQPPRDDQTILALQAMRD